MNDDKNRLASWVLVIDTCFAIFFNCTPQLAVSDMMADFPAADRLFRAETASKFLDLLPSEPADLLPLSHAEFTKVLLHDAWDMDYLCERVTISQVTMSIACEY